MVCYSQQYLIRIYTCLFFPVTKVNLPIGETKNRVPFVKVCWRVGVACMIEVGVVLLPACRG